MALSLISSNLAKFLSLNEDSLKNFFLFYKHIFKEKLHLKPSNSKLTFCLRDTKQGSFKFSKYSYLKTPWAYDAILPVN